MRWIVPLLVALVLASCVTPRTQAAPSFYDKACASAGWSSEVVALNQLHLNNITTFKAAEFTGCPGDRNILLVSWQGEMTVVKVDLARQVAGAFFSEFHTGEKITFTELDAISEDGISTVVFQFVWEVRESI